MVEGLRECWSEIVVKLCSQCLPFVELCNFELFLPMSNQDHVGELVYSQRSVG